MLEFSVNSVAKFCALVRQRGLLHTSAYAGRMLLLYAIGLLSRCRIAVLNSLIRSDAFVAFRYKPLVRRFNRLCYLLRTNTFDDTRFLGKHILKFPTDLWVYQEIIHELRPDVIIESGVFLGGSTYYFARLCELVGTGRIIGIDKTLANVDPDTTRLPNVMLIEGDSTDEAVFQSVKAHIRDNERVMVILDSDHDAQHVLREIRLYAQLVTPGQYLVVEDGIVDDVYPPMYDGGPLQAISQFLESDTSFTIDHSRNKYLLTVSPGGYLRKLEPTGSATSEADLYRPVTLWLPGWKMPSEPGWWGLLGQGKTMPRRDE